jgi:hypothetical protein
MFITKVGCHPSHHSIIIIQEKHKVKTLKEKCQFVISIYDYKTFTINTTKIVLVASHDSS